MIGGRLLQIQIEISVRSLGGLFVGVQNEFVVSRRNLPRQETDLLRISGVFEQAQDVRVEITRAMRVVL